MGLVKTYMQIKEVEVYQGQHLGPAGWLASGRASM
jgi:hypothetical protein